MRTFFWLLVTSVVLSACQESVKGPNGVAYKNPVEYNDFIVTRQTSLVKKVMDFGEVTQTDLDSAVRLLEIFEKQTAGMIEEIRGMPPYKGDSSLRDAAIRSFRFYQRVFNDDYKRLVAIRQEGGDATEEGVAEMNRIVANLSREEEQLDRSFQQAQRNFAIRHKMKLVENGIQKQIDRMNRD